MQENDYLSMIKKELAKEKSKRRRIERIQLINEKYDHLKDKLVLAVNLLLIDAENNYPETYYALDEDDNISDLQTDFNEPGYFKPDQDEIFEIEILKRGNKSYGTEFVLFNYNYDQECNTEEDISYYPPGTDIYDTIRVTKNDIVVIPFNSGEIHSKDFYEYPLVERIINRAIEDINNYINNKKLEREKIQNNGNLHH